MIFRSIGSITPMENPKPCFIEQLQDILINERFLKISIGIAILKNMFDYSKILLRS